MTDYEYVIRTVKDFMEKLQTDKNFNEYLCGIINVFKEKIKELITIFESIDDADSDLKEVIEYLNTMCDDYENAIIEIKNMLVRD